MDAPLSRNPSRTLWQGYSPDMTDEAIRAAYTVKYGSHPRELLRQVSIVLCGPVPQGKDGDSDTPNAATGLESAV